MSGWFARTTASMARDNLQIAVLEYAAEVFRLRVIQPVRQQEHQSQHDKLIALLADPAQLTRAATAAAGWAIPEAAEKLADAVAAGVGLAGCHGGMCDSFRNDVVWQFMTGAQWVAHPGNDGVEYKVRMVSDDPLVAGIDDFMVKTEQYYLHVDPAVRIHAVCDFPIVEGPHAVNGPVAMPVVFTKGWGKGRVYYNALGHQANVIDHGPAREMIRRGMAWAAR